MTVLHLECGFFSRLDIEASHSRDDILSLHPVGAYVLHGRSPYCSGDKREVLQAPELIFAALLHQLIPLHPGAYCQRHRVSPHIEILDIVNSRAEHRTLEIPSEKDVRSLSYAEQRSRQRVEIQTLQVLDTVVFDITGAGHPHSEGILRTERVIEFFFNHYLSWTVLCRQSSSN